MADTTKTLEMLFKAKDEASAIIKGIGKAIGDVRLQLNAIRATVGSVASGIGTLAAPLKFVFFDIPKQVFGFFIDLAKKAALGIAGIAAAMTAFAVKFAVDMETATGKLRTFAAFSETTAAALRKNLTDAAVDSGQKIEDLATSSAKLANAFGNQSDTLTALRATARAATGTFSELGRITDAVTSITNVYGLAADKVGVALDVIRVAQRQGRGDFAEFIDAMGESASISEDVGLSIEQQAAMLAILSREEKSASKAAASLAAILKQVQKHAGELGKEMDISLLSKDPAAFFEELNRVSKETGKNFVQMFRAEAGGAILDFLSNLDAFRDALAQTREPVSDLEELFVRASETVEVKMRQLTGAVRGALAEIGTGLFPLIKPPLDALKNLIRDNADEIRRWASILEFAAHEAATTIAAVAREIRESELFQGGLLDALKRVTLGVVGFITGSIAKVTPALANAFFETGTLAARSFLQAFADVFRTAKPIDEAMRIQEERIREAQRSIKVLPVGSGAAEVAQNTFKEARALFEDLIFLKHEMGQKDDRLIGSATTIRRAQEAMNSVLESTKEAVAGVTAEFQTAASSTLGEKAWENIVKLVADAGTRVREFAASLEATDAPAGSFRGFIDGVAERVQSLIDLVKRAAGVVRPGLDALGPTGTGRPGQELEPDPMEGAHRNNKFIPQMAEQSKEFSVGINKFAEDTKKHLEDMAQFAEGVMFTMQDGIADGFDRTFERIRQGIFTVKDAALDMAQSVLNAIQRIASQRLAERVAGALAGAAGGALGSFFSPGTAGGTGENVDITALLEARGGLFPGSFMPLRAFSRGGRADRPTIGVIAEAGQPEAVVPLPDGRSIPVRMSGGGGGTTIIMNIQATDAASFAGQLQQGEVRRALLGIIEDSRSRSPLLAARRR